MLACLSPVILAGLVSVVQMPWHSVYDASHFQAGTLQVQTCELGVGGNFKATTNGIVSAGLQYGLKKDLGRYSISVTPFAGGAYSAEDFTENATRLNFSLGAQIMGGFDQYRLAVEFWHLSNAGLAYPNYGLDMISVLTGVAF